MGFRRLSKKSANVAAERLTGNHVARLAQWTAPKAGVDNDLSEATTAKPSPTIRRAPAKTTRRKEAARRKMGHNLLLLLLLFLRLATRKDTLRFLRDAAVPIAMFQIRQKSAGGGATKMQHTAKLQLRCAINAALWLRRAC